MISFWNLAKNRSSPSPPVNPLPRRLLAATLPAVLAGRDFARLARGVEAAPARGLADRAALIATGIRGRV